MATNTNSVAAILRAQAATLRTQADALDALADTVPARDAADPLLDLAGVESEGVSRHTARSWIRSGRLEAHQAERGRFVFRRSALLRALEAAPVRQRGKHAEPSNLDDWEREADRSLRLVGGAR